jgi:hypothetical protein
MFVDTMLIGIIFCCRTTYKEVVQNPLLPYASVVFGTYTQASPFPGATVGIGIGFCCQTTYKTSAVRLIKNSRKLQASLCLRSVWYKETQKTFTKKTLFQQHFLYHKFHTSGIGLNARPVVREVTDLLNHGTASL